jgi:diguanylate cyclase (GGDEF)-like protein
LQTRVAIRQAIGGLPYVEFLNQKMRKFWDLTPEKAASKPAYAELVAKAARAYHHASPSFDLNRYGHAVGDEALISVANACRKGKRDPDIVERLGGEEFAILLPETDLSQARVVADRLVKNVAGHSLTAHSVHFNVTVSIGFAAATLSMPGFEALLNGADQALYQAKSSGRNCSVAWSPPIVPKLAAE